MRRGRTRIGVLAMAAAVLALTASLAQAELTARGGRPPALRGISIAINQGGRLDAHGLPVCRRSEIEPSSTREALARCGAALVGGGHYAADVAFPEQTAFPSDGRILAFNSVVGGKRAILAHIYDSEPVPITRVVVFHVRERRGTYGTILSGQRRSYLSAACDAPAGFPGATFPFARASMSFADDRTLSSVLTRSCKVSG